METLLKQATEVYNQNFKPIAWYGRCIFISWYCDVGTCKFCYRSTQKSRIQHAKHAQRSMASLLSEIIIAKNLNWRIEFLTGGYKIYSLQELVNITKILSEAYGHKLWINLGTLTPEEIKEFKPYIEGITASIETTNPELHKNICPDKPIQPYKEMLNSLKDLKKSITIVIGLGEQDKDVQSLHDFIKETKIDRITFYALKPIEGTPFKEGPTTEHYIKWIAKTRIAFPKLEIIAGTTFRRSNEAELLMRAGANAITKFPATKKFNSKEAQSIEEQIKRQRTFESSLTKLPNIDWNKEVDNLNISEELKIQTKEALKNYIKTMSK